MADLIECSCLGTNPDCFKCDGKGYVARPASIAPIDQLARLAAARRRAPSRRPPPPPRWAKPERRPRTQPAPPPTRTTAPAKLPAVYTCACSMRVNASQKAAHDRVCPRRPRTQTAPKSRGQSKPAAQSKTGRETYRCVCGATPLLKNKSKHTKRCPSHAPLAPKPLPAVSMLRGPERMHEDDVPRGRLQRSSDRDERRLDAVRGVGLVVRESGRYGSPSVYDRMDDESDA